MTDTLPDGILAFIQKCISRIPVIVLGSGASMAYGIAGMDELAQYLMANITPMADDAEKWSNFKMEVASGLDLETALLKVSVSEILEKEIVKRTRELIIQKDIEVLNSIIKNETKLPMSKLLEHFSRTTSSNFMIITTNYDRLAEYAVDQADLVHYTGFEVPWTKFSFPIVNSGYFSHLHIA